ncbi:unnamed protein product [Arabidopsis arenosa]|uniref:Uncharacterized protein n=1 Tax=Arabidopsis arenosa TaxID=38785 RepID=A0A8S2AN65_ARAAE|nr:unnamed protein product [Arabidopsis arenosa]
MRCCVHRLSWAMLPLSSHPTSSLFCSVSGGSGSEGSSFVNGGSRFSKLDVDGGVGSGGRLSG